MCRLIFAAFAALSFGVSSAQVITYGGPTPINASTLPLLTPSNGYGPVEINRSNGEQGAGDGKPLTASGKVYPLGLGMHAPANVGVELPANCAAFSSLVAVDDEVGKNGGAIFSLQGDGRTLATSKALKGGDAPVTLAADVTGVKALRLIVLPSAASNDYAHADWLAPTLTCVTWAGPTIITKGGTYSGLWETTDPNRPAIDIQTSEPVTITRSQIKGVGSYGLITGFHNRLTITDTVFTGMRPAAFGGQVPHAINLGEVYSLDVQHNLLDHTAGLYVNRFQGDPAKGETIRILYNESRNADGRLSDGKGGFQQGAEQREIVNFAMFNNVFAPGAEIAWNQDINQPYQSLVEDNINMYNSAGSAAKPILIHDNYVQGAYNIDPLGKMNFTGGGILIGDGPYGDPVTSAHVRVFGNQVVGTLNYGLGIVGGVDMQVYGNTVTGSGFLPDGRPAGYANVGLMNWNYYKAPVTGFGQNVMRDNVIAWTARQSDGTPSDNPWWLVDCRPETQSVCVRNTVLGEGTLAMEQAERARWNAKLAAAGIVVGPSN